MRGVCNSLRNETEGAGDPETLLYSNRKGSAYDRILPARPLHAMRGAALHEGLSQWVYLSGRRAQYSQDQSA